MSCSPATSERLIQTAFHAAQEPVIQISSLFLFKEFKIAWIAGGVVLRILPSTRRNTHLLLKFSADLQGNKT